MYYLCGKSPCLWHMLCCLIAYVSACYQLIYCKQKGHCWVPLCLANFTGLWCFGVMMLLTRLAGLGLFARLGLLFLI